MKDMLSSLILLSVTLVPVFGGLKWNLNGNVHPIGLEKYLKGSTRRERLFTNVKDMMQGMCAYSETVKTINQIKKDRTQMQSEMDKFMRTLKSAKYKLISERRREGMLRTCGGKIQDCTGIKGKTCAEGVYELNPDNKTPFNAYCDVKTDGGGWTVIQRRQSGVTDFYRNWKDYKDGFGDIANEYWLGNEKIYKMTSKARYELRIELEDWGGETRYAVYKSFSIGSESSNYRLSIGSYSGNAGNGLSINNGKPFSTRDKDSSSAKCPKVAVGAWWYAGCTHSNLNGEYLMGKHNKSDVHRGVVWYHWKGWRHSLQVSTMMIRRY